MKLGSMAGWEHWSEVAGIPYKDWTEIFPRGPLRETFGPEAYLKKIEKVRIACPSCSLPCKEGFTFQDERNAEAHTFASSFIGRVTAFGVRGGVGSFRELLICHDLCNRLGLDTYSTGAMIDYAIKLYEDGLLKKSDAGFALKRNFATTQRLIRQIANREGVGALLAEGFAETGKNFGRAYEAQIKGMDFIFDARCYRLGTYEFEQIVNPRGGHQHAGGSPTYGARDFPISSMKEFCRAISIPAPSMDRIFTDPRGFNVARLTKHCEEWYSVFSLLGVCSRKNIKAYYNMDLLAEIFLSVTGLEMNGQGLKQAGERAWNLLKLLNVGEGFTREKDRAPRNWFKPLKDGTKELVLQDYYGKGPVGPDDLESLLDEYYDEHGWCLQHGVPMREKIAELGLRAEWEELKRQGAIPQGSCHLA
jgi:aldehyde:ferredoxin oxidoreductase